MRLMAGRLANDDRGLSMVEMLVSMLVLSVVTAALSSTLVGSRETAESVRQVTNLNEEARLALNRISRELRQAKEITGVGGTGGATSLSFSVDFDGDLAISSNSADPEMLTYQWDSVNKRILLKAPDPTGVVLTQPILSGEVEAFRFDYRSSLYVYDCNGDGLTTWQELDTPGACFTGTPVGNSSGTLDAAELAWIDSVVVSFTVLDGSREQDYRTQVDLRNAQ